MSAVKCELCEEEYNQELRKPRQLDCGCILCEKCLKGIYRLQQKFKCRKHNISTQRPIETLQILNLVNQQIQNSAFQDVCLIHRQQFLTLYCIQDNIRICIQCQQVLHQEHGYITTQEAVQQMKSYLESTFIAVKQRLVQYISKLNQCYRQLSQQQIQRIENMVQVQLQVQNIKQACQEMVNGQQSQIKKQMQLIKDTSNYYQQIESQINSMSNISQDSFVSCENKRNYLNQLQVIIQDRFQSIEQSSSVEYRENLSKQALFDYIVTHLMEKLQPNQVYLRQLDQAKKIKQLQLVMKRLYQDFQQLPIQQEQKEQEYHNQISSLNQQVSFYFSQVNYLTTQINGQDKAIKDITEQLIKAKQETSIAVQQIQHDQQLQLKNKDEQFQAKQLKYAQEIQELQQQNACLQQDLTVSQQLTTSLQGQISQENLNYQEQIRILLNEQDNLKSTNKQLEDIIKNQIIQLKQKEQEIKDLPLSFKQYKSQAKQIQVSNQSELVNESICKHQILKRVNKEAPRITTYKRVFYYSNKIQSYQLDNVDISCSYSTVSEMTSIYTNASSTYYINDDLLIQVGGYDIETYLDKILQITTNSANTSSNSVIKSSAYLIQPRSIQQIGYDNDRQVYILGGADPTSYSQSSHPYRNYLNSFEVYDIGQNTSKSLPSFKNYIAANGIYVQYQRVWIIGGQIQNSNRTNDKQFSSCISSYDILLNVYQEYATQLPKPAASLASVYVNENEQAYIWDNQNKLNQTCVFDTKAIIKDGKQYPYIPNTSLFWYNGLFANNRLWMWSNAHKAQPNMIYSYDIKSLANNNVKEREWTAVQLNVRE